MIRFEGVSKAFGEVVVLDEVAFAVAPQEVVAVLGPSGSGKTTLMRLIVGELRPDRGQVCVNAARIGYIFQEPRLLPWRTARQNICLALRAQGVGRASALEQADAWLARMGLQGFERYYPAQLSGGMLQRVSIGRALAIRPQLLLMDEPFSSLNMELRESLLALVERVIEEGALTAVYVTHYLPEALRLARRVLWLSGGGCVEELGEERRAMAITAFIDSVSRAFGDVMTRSESCQVVASLSDACSVELSASRDGGGAYPCGL